MQLYLICFCFHHPLIPHTGLFFPLSAVACPFSCNMFGFNTSSSKASSLVGLVHFSPISTAQLLHHEAFLYTNANNSTNQKHRRVWTFQHAWAKLENKKVMVAWGVGGTICSLGSDIVVNCFKNRADWNWISLSCCHFIILALIQ